MSISHIFNQKACHFVSLNDGYASTTKTYSSTFACRINEQQKLVTSAKGEQVVSGATILCLEENVAAGDYLFLGEYSEYNNEKDLVEVINIKRVVDRLGRLKLIEISV